MPPCRSPLDRNRKQPAIRKPTPTTGRASRATTSIHGRAVRASAGAGPSGARRHVIDDDDDDDDDEDLDYRDIFHNFGEPAEEYDEEVDEEVSEAEQEAFHREHPRRAAGSDEDEDVEDVDDEAEDEAVDGFGDDASLQQLLVLQLKGQRKMQEEQVKTNKLLVQALAARGDSGRAPPRAPGAGHQPRRRARPVPPASLPLDGVQRLFGPGFRKQATQAIAPQWFKRVGVSDVLLPYNQTAPIAMQACGLDSGDIDLRSGFDGQYKSETSRLSSKVKQTLSNIFVDQLMTLNKLPSIIDAGTANPPNLIAHRVAFKALREPPAGFSPDSAHYQYSASWHAAMDTSNALMNFENPLARKLLQVDFFSRAAAKGLLPRAAQKWNLGSLAYFLLFTKARLTIKSSAAGREVYGNLKDGADAIREIENICEWLMDPVACPTTWPVLLTIREQNPMYGTTHQPAVA